MQHTTPVLLPQPRLVTWGPDVILLPAELVVAVTSRQQELLPAIQRFKRYAQAQLGITVSIAAAPTGLEGKVHVTVDPACPTISHPQGYGLTVGEGRISIAAATAEGAAYGLATLGQILAGCGRQVQEVVIEDWPDFGRRGVMLDISRGKVPTMATLEKFVDLLADMKVNEFQLYTEHTYAYRNHREVWQNYSPMTGEEILQLDRYCKERFIDLVPNQNSFGHMHPWLIHEKYSHLAEAPDGFDTPWGARHEGPFSFCPGDPGVTELLSEMYDELLPHFTSPYFNVGCDETWDVGQGRSKEAVEKFGEHRVYVDQLLRIYEQVKARGRTMMFWGDIIMKAPEYVAELPKDIIALEWGYEAEHPFDDHGAHFAKAGIPFYVCPGTSTWNSLVGRTENALGNLRNAAENGLKHGAIGYLNTMWGDRGHQDYQPVAYLPLAYGAGVSWAVSANRDADVRPFLNKLVFGDRSEWIGQVLHQLGNVYKVGGFEPPNGTALCGVLHYGLTHKRMTGMVIPTFDVAAAEKAIHEAVAGLDEVELTCADGPLVLRELRNSVRLMLHMCQYIRMVQARLAGNPFTPAQIGDLARDLEAIVAEHRDLWLARNRVGGLEEMGLVPFRAFQAEYRKLGQK
ncbi:MAG TPA: family 20 glycosylhydrolase [Symbiobacteriaceae bacterium]|nr:family 20 glycosylhydrolase [Symbiobacteriaceae bacterium]